MCDVQCAIADPIGHNDTDDLAELKALKCCVLLNLFEFQHWQPLFPILRTEKPLPIRLVDGIDLSGAFTLLKPLLFQGKPQTLSPNLGVFCHI